MKDADGQLAPIVQRTGDPSAEDMAPSQAELLERRRLQEVSVPFSKGSNDVMRGFGYGYEDFDDEIHSGKRVMPAVYISSHHFARD
jgi:hypothetical protein